MFDRELRLGDTIDDYCTRCKLILNHGVVAIVDGEVKKTRCLTCSFEHPYREGKGGRPKKNGVQSLFDQVVATMPGSFQSTTPDRKKKKSSSRKK